MLYPTFGILPIPTARQTLIVHLPAGPNSLKNVVLVSHLLFEHFNYFRSFTVIFLFPIHLPWFLLFFFFHLSTTPAKISSILKFQGETYGLWTRFRTICTRLDVCTTHHTLCLNYRGHLQIIHLVLNLYTRLMTSKHYISQFCIHGFSSHYCYEQLLKFINWLSSGSFKQQAL